MKKAICAEVRGVIVLRLPGSEERVEGRRKGEAWVGMVVARRRRAERERRESDLGAIAYR